MSTPPADPGPVDSTAGQSSSSTADGGSGDGQQDGDASAGSSPAGEFDGATPVDPARFDGLVTDIGFQSPSGNIHCGIQDGTVVCQLDEHSYTPPPHDCGDSGWGFNFRIQPQQPAEMFCAGDVEGGGPTLKYGQEITVGDVRCVSREDGVVCQNTASGYGFRVAKADYVFFGSEGAGGSGDSTTIPAALVGQWVGHGRSLTISADGSSMLGYRTYRFCSDDPTPPCDTTTQSEIVPGGHITFHLLAPEGTDAATGTVTKSNDPTVPVDTDVTATVSGYNLELSFWPGTMFCAPDTPSDQWNCGA